MVRDTAWKLPILPCGFLTETHLMAGAAGKLPAEKQCREWNRQQSISRHQSQTANTSTKMNGLYPCSPAGLDLVEGCS